MALNQYLLQRELKQLFHLQTDMTPYQELISTSTDDWSFCLSDRISLSQISLSLVHSVETLKECEAVQEMKNYCFGQMTRYGNNDPSKMFQVPTTNIFSRDEALK